MSRLAKRSLPLPANVQVTLDGRVLHARGPKGELSLSLPPSVQVVEQDGALQVSVPKPQNVEQRARWGLGWKLVKNTLEGVSQGFSKQLEINGVGYRAAIEGGVLTLRVGYSHPVTITPPSTIKVTVEKNIITVAGLDRQLVGQVAADIRATRPPEPYKGKGIRYVDEFVRRKAGKAAKSTS